MGKSIKLNTKKTRPNSWTLWKEISSYNAIHNTNGIDKYTRTILTYYGHWCVFFCAFFLLYFPFLLSSQTFALIHKMKRNAGFGIWLHLFIVLRWLSVRCTVNSHEIDVLITQLCVRAYFLVVSRFGFRWKWSIRRFKTVNTRRLAYTKTFASHMKLKASKANKHKMVLSWVNWIRCRGRMKNIKFRLKVQQNMNGARIVIMSINDVYVSYLCVQSETNAPS